MPQSPRAKPARLAEKLLRVREMLDLSQSGMLKELGIEDGYRNYISDFENGKKVPSLPVLLAYADSVGVYMDVLVNDELDLPDMAQPEGRVKHGGVRRKPKSQVKPTIRHGSMKSRSRSE